jgi:hypothetical protein
MDTVEIVYYTCMNDECDKYRNVFAEGDPLHANCARERLWLQGEQRGMPMWAWLAAPIALAAAAGAVFAFRRARKNMKQKRTLYGEERRSQTWSGAHTHLDEREGYPVPPPIS